MKTMTFKVTYVKYSTFVELESDLFKHKKNYYFITF